MPARPRVSVVVPCYNEVDSLSELHRRVSATCRELLGTDYELLLINDGSTDATWQLMRTLAAADPCVVCVDLSRNHGHQLALSAGLQLCLGAQVFVIDADLQDPPELLGPMMASMAEGHDVVYGQRIRREGETAFKKATAFVFYRLLRRMADIDIPPDTGDFRLMSRRAVDVLNNMPEHHRFIRGMVSWIGLSQVALPYERAARFAGETKYPLARMIRFASDAITGFSIRPLRLASYSGMAAGLATLLLLGYVLIAYFTGSTVSGWTSLAVIILALGSAQLFVVGVLGEYLGRLYMESKRRPLYIVREVLRSAAHVTAAPPNPTAESTTP